MTLKHLTDGQFKTDLHNEQHLDPNAVQTITLANGAAGGREETTAHRPHMEKFHVHNAMSKPVRPAAMTLNPVLIPATLTANLHKMRWATRIPVSHGNCEDSSTGHRTQ